MKSNSPNPVYGDVQALIADCQAEIEDLKRSINRCDAIGTSDYLYQLQSKLKRQYAALASLTAEPIGFIHNYVNPGDTETTSAIFKEENRHYARAVYLNPPAQLLRPVELPDISARRYYTEEGVFKAFDYKRDLKEAIRVAGGEVKP